LGNEPFVRFSVYRYTVVGAGKMIRRKNNYRNSFWTILWKYLNQPLFHKKKSICLNPFKFEKFYKVELLERCWQLDFETEKGRS